MDTMTPSDPTSLTAAEWTTIAENANLAAITWWSLLGNHPIVPTAAGAGIPVVIPAAAPYAPVGLGLGGISPMLLLAIVVGLAIVLAK